MREKLYIEIDNPEFEKACETHDPCDCQGVCSFDWPDETIQCELPSRYEVCSRCDGEGKTYLGHMESYAFTAEDFDREGPGFREDYISGKYDRECPQCQGRRVELVANVDAMSEELSKLYFRKLQADADFERLCAAERRYGC